ncbi:hypothetical protein BVX93_02235, partial [bacterium B13(2017)]
VNPDQMKQVFFNLITNAIDAMKNGGKILISTLCEEKIVTILIKDTGMGIPKENIDKIFDLFYTTKEQKGTGLGLSTCFDIIKKHKGRILVDSEIGKGTTFTIILPI